MNRRTSTRAKLVNKFLSSTLKPILTLVPINDKSFYYTRLAISGLSLLVPNNLHSSIIRFHIDDIPCEWVQTNDYDASDNNLTRVILYLHGGAYIVGSPQTHRQITTQLAKLSGARVLAIDYRKGPDHHFPAAHNDALTAYKWLLKQGYNPKNIAFAGDSAGGNLCIGLAKILKKDGLELPSCMCLMSPWTNMMATFPAVIKNEKSDPYLPGKRMLDAAKLYAGNTPLDNELLSPVFGDLSGLPPTLVHCSDIEIVEDDSVEFVRIANSQGSNVKLQIFRGVCHVWQFFYWYIPEGRESLEKLSEFMISNWEN